MENTNNKGLESPKDYYPIVNVKKYKEQLKLLDKTIHELSIRYLLDEKQVRLVIESQFKFVAEVIRSGEWKSVRLQNLGVFGVKKGRREWKERQIKEQIIKEQNDKQT